MKSITVLLPAFNEEKAIGRVIQDIKALKLGYEILVVNNKSTNGTKAEAIALGAKVLYEGKKGKGNAVRVGFKHIKTPFVVMIDSDFTYPAKHLPEIIRSLDNGADVVIGYRNKRAKGSISHMNIIGNWGLSMLASILYGVYVRDVCSGMWGFKRDALSSYKLTSNGFTLEADLFVNTIKGKHKLVQIPIEYRARLDGSVAKLGIKDGFKIGWFLIKGRFR